MSKRVYVFMLLATMTGCSATAPSGLVNSQAPSYGYQPLGGTMDATRPEGQTIRLVYGGKRYQVTPADEAQLRDLVASAVYMEAPAMDLDDLRNRVAPGIVGQVKRRFKYNSAVNTGMRVMRAMEGQPIPMVAMSSDPATPCTIELPPPRNSGDADFFRALGEATFACMRGNWR